MKRFSVKKEEQLEIDVTLFDALTGASYRAGSRGQGEGGGDRGRGRTLPSQSHSKFGRL